jgi:hypothetical protein
MTAAMHDPDVFRGLLEIITCLAQPQQVMARPGMAQRVARFADAPPPPPTPGPDRAGLLALLAG